MQKIAHDTPLDRVVDLHVDFPPTCSDLCLIFGALKNHVLATASVTNVVDLGSLSGSNFFEHLRGQNVLFIVQNQIFERREEMASFLGGMKALRHVSLINTRVQQYGLSVLLQSASLETLEMDGCLDLSVEQKSFPTVSKLRAFRVFNSNFLDADRLVKLVDFSRLEELKLVNCSLTNQQAERLLERAPLVVNLSLAKNFLTNSVVGVLEKIPGLRWVDLSDNFLTAGCLRRFQQFGALENLNLQRNLVLKCQDIQLKFQANLQENPPKGFHFPISHEQFINNFSQKNQILRMLSAVHFYENLQSVRTLVMGSGQTEVKERLMRGQNVILEPEMLVGSNLLESRQLLSRLTDFRLEKVPPSFRNFQSLRLNNIRFLQIQANLLHFLPCFPSVFCLEIKGYTGQVLTQIPLSLRVLVLRDYEAEIEFPQNVVLVQLKNTLKIHPGLQESLMSMTDFGELPPRWLLSLGIIRVSQDEAQKISKQLPPSEIEDVPEELSEPDEEEFEQWIRGQNVSMARYQTKKQLEQQRAAESEESKLKQHKRGKRSKLLGDKEGDGQEQPKEQSIHEQIRAYLQGDEDDMPYVLGQSNDQFVNNSRSRFVCDSVRGQDFSTPIKEAAEPQSLRSRGIQAGQQTRTEATTQSLRLEPARHISGGVLDLSIHDAAKKPSPADISRRKQEELREPIERLLTQQQIRLHQSLGRSEPDSYQSEQDPLYYQMLQSTDGATHLAVSTFGEQSFAEKSPKHIRKSTRMSGYTMGVQEQVKVTKLRDPPVLVTIDGQKVTLGLWKNRAVSDQELQSMQQQFNLEGYELVGAIQETSGQQERSPADHDADQSMGFEFV